MTFSKKIRLAALDLDGTLLRNDGLISPANLRALRNWEATGRHVVIATGRPPRAVRYLANALHEQAVAICSNGALLYDFGAETVVTRETLDDQLVIDLVTRMRDVIPEATYEIEFGLRGARDVDFPELGNPVPEVIEGDVLDLMTEPVAKLVVWNADSDPDALFEQCSEVVDGRATVTSSGAPWIEISALGVDKAQALEHYCAELGVEASEVVAMGDGLNDLPMLRWAGTSVAMGNADVRVVEAATHRTSTNTDDGVAAVLNEIMAN